ncbi:calpain 9 [Phyllostomus discolor]|uniref:Calpain 9 n=1 Tax=Phyllostomus discolor TaxID=89673 RepID=A0A834DAG4_9CHIR|nr:calpain 9 [Phyllostomus discolor]
MQKDRRKLKRFGADVLTIGYAIYQCPGKEEHLSKDFFRYHASRARSKTFVNLREVSDRFKLPPGEYILIPSTFEPHQEADFCLRIFSEKKAVTRDLDGDVDVELPEPPKPTPPAQETKEHQEFRALFQRIAGEDMAVNAEELEYVLNAVLRKKKGIRFKQLSLVSCKNIISLMDTSGNGKLEFDEFKVFWDKLKTWIDLFLQFDADKSGTMSSYELRTALRAAGFQLSSHLLQLIVLRYADEDLQLGFDDFLNCLVRLENASRECAGQCVSSAGEGSPPPLGPLPERAGSTLPTVSGKTGRGEAWPGVCDWGSVGVHQSLLCSAFAPTALLHTHAVSLRRGTGWSCPMSDFRSPPTLAHGVRGGSLPAFHLPLCSVSPRH